jgi:hypothetical protein
LDPSDIIKAFEGILRVKTTTMWPRIAISLFGGGVDQKVGNALFEFQDALRYGMHRGLGIDSPALPNIPSYGFGVFTTTQSEEQFVELIVGQVRHPGPLFPSDTGAIP